MSATASWDSTEMKMGYKLGTWGGEGTAHLKFCPWHLCRGTLPWHLVDNVFCWFIFSKQLSMLLLPKTELVTHQAQQSRLARCWLSQMFKQPLCFCRYWQLRETRGWVPSTTCCTHLALQITSCASLLQMYTLPVLHCQNQSASADVSLKRYTVTPCMTWDWDTYQINASQVLFQHHFLSILLNMARPFISGTSFLVIILGGMAT